MGRYDMRVAQVTLQVIVTGAFCVGITVGSDAATLTERHHVTIGAGFTTITDEFSSWHALNQPDDGTLLQLGYRYSISSKIDLGLTVQSTRGSSTATSSFPDTQYEVTHLRETQLLGPTARWTPLRGFARPFLELTVSYVRDQIRNDVDWVGIQSSGSEVFVSFGRGKDPEDGVGVALAGGAELTLSPLVSVPIKVSYMRSSLEDELEQFGVQAGISMNFNSPGH